MATHANPSYGDEDPKRPRRAAAAASDAAADISDEAAARLRTTLPMALPSDERQMQRRFWPKFWRTLGRIPFSEELAAAYFCARDPMTPPRVKGVLLAALAYFVVPTDLLPDFIAALGFTDDATVLATAMGVVGAHVKLRHQNEARALLARPAPTADTQDHVPTRPR